MPFILGKKLKMSQIWKNDKVIPVTLIQAGPVTVTQLKTKEKDGYEAVQVGFGHAKKLNKPQLGHVAKLKTPASAEASAGKQNTNVKTFSPRYLKEFKTDSQYNLGDEIDLSLFKEGDRVKVSGLNKGRGFQGVVKRHGFHGGPKTHGQKNRHRAPGSIGATAPQRIMPGRKMAGRMGGARTTVKNLEIAGIDKEKNILLIKGAVPGNKGVLLEIRK